MDGQVATVTQGIFFLLHIKHLFPSNIITMLPFALYFSSVIHQISAWPPTVTIYVLGSPCLGKLNVLFRQIF